MLANLLNGRARGLNSRSAAVAQALAEYLGVAVAELFPPDGES
jgi:hypothetical protein